MAVYRVDVLTEDPRPVFEWIEDNVAGNLMVRRVAYKTVRGWYVKAVFKRQGDAELFHRHWRSDENEHTVPAFRTLT
jgi:hypothetical protein